MNVRRWGCRRRRIEPRSSMLWRDRWERLVPWKLALAGHLSRSRASGIRVLLLILRHRRHAGYRRLLLERNERIVRNATWSRLRCTERHV